jgi:hypothetical protein
MPKTPIDMVMDGVEWIPVAGRVVPQDDDIPYVTHEGLLDFCGLELKVYTLSDRTRRQGRKGERGSEQAA